MTPVPTPNSVKVPLRVLLVEDLPDDADLIIVALESAGYAVAPTRVDAEADYINALKNGADVILCDEVLPGFSSARAFSLLQGYAPEVPFIIVSGRIGDDLAVQALRDGADDYLLKDRLARLGPAVRGALERRRLMSETRKFCQLIQHIPQLFWVSGAAQTSLSYASPAFEKLTGRTLMDVGHNREDWLNLVHDDDRERVKCAWSRHPALGAYDTQYRMVHADGTQRWVHERAFCMPSGPGEIDSVAGIMEDVTERMDAQGRLLYAAHYDHLTALPNRVLFYDRLRQALAQAQRNDRHVAVFLIDLDRFKIVNDTLGHAIGDKVLQQVAQRLARCLRTQDTVGRLGGDEFGVILTEVAAPADAGLVAKQIVASFGEFIAVEGNELFTTVSIGIALHPSDSESVDGLVRAADAAMYGAKSSGGNGYQFYTADMNERALEKVQLEHRLRRALERGEFLLHFQPKVDLVTGEVSGFEALIRWQPPDGALVAPDDFIPTLEETGLIVPVGQWVLRSACKQVRAWTDAGIRPMPIAINVSARQLRDQDLCAVVRAALHEYDVAPRLLDIEITESAAMQNTDVCIAALKELKALGIHVSLDDFGTGYSSLSYLQRLPVNALKIDRSFIADLATNPDDASIAKAVINMAHNLGLTVVAEGVESEAQLSFLTAHGCDQIQGYYFSRPLAESDATDLLREHRRLRRPASANTETTSVRATG